MEKLKQLGQHWEIMNEKYDNMCRGIIANPASLTTERLAEMKKIQDEIFDLEVEIMRLAQELNV